MCTRGGRGGARMRAYDCHDFGRLPLPRFSPTSAGSAYGSLLARPPGFPRICERDIEMSGLLIWGISTSDRLLGFGSLHTCGSSASPWARFPASQSAVCVAHRCAAKGRGQSSIVASRSPFLAGRRSLVELGVAGMSQASIMLSGCPTPSISCSLRRPPWTSLGLVVSMSLRRSRRSGTSM